MAKKTRRKTKAKKVVKPATVKISFSLKSVPRNKEFILADGRHLKDVRELAMALTDMADDVFWHHVNDSRNDFAHWIDDAIKDKDLAESISSVRDKVGAQLEILKHLVSKIP